MLKTSQIFSQCCLQNSCGIASFMFTGGSPYPRINGRDIANNLKTGYRMPKPKHVDQQL